MEKQTFTLEIPNDKLEVILTAVVSIHGLSEGQTPDQRAKELVVQFLGNIVNIYLQKKTLEQLNPVDMSGIE